MATFLFITPEEMKATTILGGNVDQDKFLPCVAHTQILSIERLLGTELYDLILDGADNGTLTGDYLELYTEYVKPVTKYQALAEYIKISGYMITNGGAFKHTPDNTELMSESEISGLADTYAGMADTYIRRFYKWMDKHSIPEYKTYQDEVNASKTIKNRSGWYFGQPSNRVTERLDEGSGSFWRDEDNYNYNR